MVGLRSKMNIYIYVYIIGFKINKLYNIGNINLIVYKKKQKQRYIDLDYNKQITTALRCCSCSI